MDKKEYTCPTCGFKTFTEPPGSYDICRICGWEDDGVQLANPACGGGANRGSLIEAQEEILKKYPLPIMETKGCKRDPKWRPLTEKEKEIYKKQRDVKYWANAAVVSEEECYWNIST